MAKILLVDDDQNLREVVAYILGEAGHEVALAGGGEEGLRRFTADRPDLVLTDVRMPGLDGIELLRRIRAAEDSDTVLDGGGSNKGQGARASGGGGDKGQGAIAPSAAIAGETPVIVLTAHGTVEQAVAAMKLGAFTYLLKPFNRDELILTVEQALRTGALVVPVFVRRTNTDHLICEFKAPFEIADTGDREADTAAGTQLVNDVIGREIMRRPGQWLWLHDRWRPDDRVELDPDWTPPARG